MTTITEQFIAWMDLRKISAERISRELNVKAQTIRNWRAAAIPQRREEHVLRVMADWDRNPTARLGRVLIIDAKPDQFRAWSEAARDDDKILEDWAREGLNEMAREHLRKTGNGPESGDPDPEDHPHLKVADAPADYPANRGSRASGN